VDGRVYELPFTGVNREADLRVAHAHFSAIATGVSTDVSR
jgi:hypothetical protein